MSKPVKKSHTAKLKHSSVSTSQVKEAKPKPKVSYPVLKRPSSAKSTYSASYTKPTTKIKTPGTGNVQWLSISVGKILFHNKLVLFMFELLKKISQLWWSSVGSVLITCCGLSELPEKDISDVMVQCR